MLPKEEFISECSWLATNLENCPPLTDFFSLGTLCIRALCNGQWTQENLRMVQVFTEVRAYIHWIHDFPLEECSWEVSAGELMDQRLAAINVTAQAYLAELGCTPENDWGRKANPPIL